MCEVDGLMKRGRRDNETKGRRNDDCRVESLTSSLSACPDRTCSTKKKQTTSELGAVSSTVSSKYQREWDGRRESEEACVGEWEEARERNGRRSRQAAWDNAVQSISSPKRALTLSCCQATSKRGGEGRVYAPWQGIRTGSRGALIHSSRVI